ncbi:MAG TPA: hypothetical protein VHB21_13045, partial [Minicystis sp.]|nr:hypothetical protein [Minicystis sp.]
AACAGTQDPNGFKSSSGGGGAVGVGDTTSTGAGHGDGAGAPGTGSGTGSGSGSGAGTGSGTGAGTGTGTGAGTGTGTGGGGTGGGANGWNLGSPSPACDATPSSAALDVPMSHPRLFWTADRLNQAKAWYAAHPFTPDSSDPLDLAFHYVVSGDTTSARSAIDQLMALDIPLQGTASDPIRWYGEWAIATYDWCYDQMTPNERSTILSRWNTAVSYWSQAAWGGIGMEADNYYWGYLRNELLWGVATYYDDAQGPAFVDHAITTRLTSSFAPYAATEARGGVPAEGTQYGRYMLGYPGMPFATAADSGRQLLTATNFHCEAVYYLLYATPGLTTRGSGNAKVTGTDMFPFNDDEMFVAHAAAESSEYGDFATMMATTFADHGVGKTARAWLARVNAPVDHYAQSVDPGGAAASVDSLPLDYFAPGAGYHYARSAWTDGATALNLQLGRPGRVGHAHIDAGNFQLWRGGRWLTRETTGYADAIVGYGGASVMTDNFAAHNVLAFEGHGLATGSDIEGSPAVVRLETQPAYSYAVVDLSKAFRAHDDGHPERDTPWAQSAVREFLFVRPLDTLVVFDRMTSQAANGTAASDVVKTAFVHFEVAPQIVDAQHVLVESGDQALALTTLVPNAPHYNVTDEGGAVGQHRLEIETSGQATSYLLDVLQARDANGQDVAASVSDDGDHYTVTLAHPTNGTAVVVLQKGAASAGGSFGYAANGAPTMAPLRGDVQAIHVGVDGPYWSP